METNQVAIARKYAQAYLNCFGHNVALADLQNLRIARDFLHAHHELVVLLTIVRFTAVESQRLADLFVQRFQLPVDLKKLFLLILQARRIYLLDTVLHELNTLYQARYHKYIFQVSSVTELLVADLDVLQSYLQAQLRKKISQAVQIELQTKLDTNLIAGIKAHNELFQWDGSVQGRLSRLEAKLGLES